MVFLGFGCPDLGAPHLGGLDLVDAADQSPRLRSG